MNHKIILHNQSAHYKQVLFLYKKEDKCGLLVCIDAFIDNFFRKILCVCTTKVDCY